MSDIGPSTGYDVIGDVHGNLDALRRLCERLGYDDNLDHPNRRRLVFVGDLANRGEKNAETLLLVMSLVERGAALSVLGNHDDALMDYLARRHKAPSASLRSTLDQIELYKDPAGIARRIVEFFRLTPIVLSLDNQRLVVAHAGIEWWMLGAPLDAQTRRFILNGDKIGKAPDGRTIRRDWARQYSGSAFIVYGHTPIDVPAIRNNTVNIDTGAYAGGELSALRWPEREIVSVPSNYSWFANASSSS